MALALALALANHPDGFSPPLGEAGRGLSILNYLVRENLTEIPKSAVVVG